MMDDMLRGALQSQRGGLARQRQGLVEAEPDATDAADRAAMTVLGPGEPDDPARFTYEPFDGAPGAWVVYPPGVPCDAAAARVSMSGPAGADDFAEMQQLLDGSEGATAVSPPPPTTGAYR